MKDFFFFLGVFYILFLLIFFLAYLIWPNSIVQDYPKELEEAEAEETKKIFEEYKKSQEKS